jgi:hypothetical protein
VSQQCAGEEQVGTYQSIIVEIQLSPLDLAPALDYPQTSPKDPKPDDSRTRTASSPPRLADWTMAERASVALHPDLLVL